MTPLCTMNGRLAPAPSPAISARRTDGYTLLEMMVAVSVFMVVSVITFSNLAPAIKDARVNGSYNQVLEEMRMARQLAVANRKTYLLTFNPPGLPVGRDGMQINQLNAGVVGTVYNQAPVLLPMDVHFQVIPGIPNTNAAVPDNMGSGATAIQFDIGVNGGAANQIYFFPDGSARDINNNINNGIVYVARDSDIYSSRAITLYGAAGRVRGWRLYPPAGVGNGTWSQL